MTLGPNVMALHGHSRAHLRHCSQNDCRLKSIGWSTSMGRSVVKTTLLERGPINGLRIVSPMRLTSPSPAIRIAGLWITSEWALECARAE